MALDPEGSEEGEDFFARSAIPPMLEEYKDVAPAPPTKGFGSVVFVR